MSKQPKPAVVLVSQRAAAAGTGGAAPHAPARRPPQIHLHARRRPSVVQIKPSRVTLETRLQEAPGTWLQPAGDFCDPQFLP